LDKKTAPASGWFAEWKGKVFFMPIDAGLCCTYLTSKGFSIEHNYSGVCWLAEE
jgi:hypothetical protein